MGIKYEELAPTRPIGKPLKEQETKSATQPRAVAAQPRTRQYEVTLRVTAVMDESFLVEARGNAEAKRDGACGFYGEDPGCKQSQIHATSSQSEKGVNSRGGINP